MKYIRLSGLVLWLCLQLTGMGQAAECRGFILHSYHSGFAWTESQHQGFIEAIQKAPGCRQPFWATEYLDTKRKSFEPSYQAAAARFFQDKYRDWTPDFIYATDDDAIGFLHRFKEDLFPGVPVFFSGANNLGLDRILDPVQFTGIYQVQDVAANVELARRLAPGQQTLLLIGDGTEPDVGNRKQIEVALAGQHAGLKPVFISHRRLAEVLRQLTPYRSGVVILLTAGGFHDEQGRLLPVAEVTAALGKAGAFNLLTLNDAYLTEPVLGGIMASGHQQGAHAAMLIRARLLDESFADMEASSLVAPSLALFDYRQLSRQGIPLGSLPAGSLLLNRPLPFWQRMPRLFWPLLTIGALMVALLAWLLGTKRRYRRAAQGQRKAAKQFKALIQASRDAIIAIDERGRITLFNSLAEQVFGWPAEDVLGGTLDRLMPETYRRQHRQDVQGFFTTGQPCEAVGRPLELLAIHRDGREFPIELELTAGGDGAERFVLATLRDITRQREVEREIRQLSWFDSLTGLPNRSLFEERFRRVLSNSERSGSMAGLLMLGVDNLKVINDTRGHSCGDQLLKLIAQKLSKSVRAEATVVRWEGDKFAILLPGLQEVAQVDDLAQKILQLFTEPFELEGNQHFSTASIGVALFPKDGTDGERLLKNADMAMYAAKEQGRHTYRYFNEDMNRRVIERSELETSLRQALAREEFYLAFQPQIDHRSGAMVGVEALLRWCNRDRGLVSPGVFIPLAEETGLILPIGNWVLRTACIQNRAWQEAGFPPFRVAVNLSARQFQQPDFYDQVARIIEETGLDPNYLELELTESVLMTDAAGAAVVLHRLRQLGVHITIDDFGTGYSSLAYLKTFPLDRIKIAQEFVLDIARDSGDAAIVETVIAMAHGLDLMVVAEGVETAEQLDFLRVRDCHIMQGYYFARPMPAEEFIEYLSLDCPVAAVAAHPSPAASPLNGA